MCCWCSCLECIHNIPPLNLIFLHFSDSAIPGEAVEAAGPASMASISVPNPVPSATEDAENIRKAVQGISRFMLVYHGELSTWKKKQ
jgi:annexin D